MVRHLIPPRLVGGRRNLKQLCKSIIHFFFLNRNETLSCHHLLQHLSVKSLAISWGLSRALTAEHHIQFSHLFARLIYFIVAHMMIPVVRYLKRKRRVSSSGLLSFPVLRSHFYVTTSEITHTRPLYFHKPVWSAVVAKLDRQLIKRHYMPCTKEDMVKLKRLVPGMVLLVTFVYDGWRDRSASLF